MSSEQLAWFFAAAPFALGIIIFVATYLAKRGETAQTVPIGQSFACASCGRRGLREHMTPRLHDGAVSWLCHRCSH